uniref:Uncharacterized protein n=1 Tax=Caenorhabditis japonica TaxID=281687 RepID=A0A8R1EIX1_CAEJA
MCSSSVMSSCCSLQRRQRQVEIKILEENLENCLKNAWHLQAEIEKFAKTLRIATDPIQKLPNQEMDGCKMS